MLSRGDFAILVVVGFAMFGVLIWRWPAGEAMTGREIVATWWRIDGPMWAIWFALLGILAASR